MYCTLYCLQTFRFLSCKKKKYNVSCAAAWRLPVHSYVSDSETWKLGRKEGRKELRKKER